MFGGEEERGFFGFKIIVGVHSGLIERFEKKYIYIYIYKIKGKEEGVDLIVGSFIFHIFRNK